MHDPTRLLAEINRRYGTAYQLLGAYTGGEQGAFALRRGDHRAVLKWSFHTDLSAYEQAAVVTAQLRTRGYPAPHFELVGRAGDGVFAIQAELPGEPARVPDLPILAHVLSLNALQAGHAVPGPHPWPDRIIHTVREVRATVENPRTGDSRGLRPRRLRFVVRRGEAAPHHKRNTLPML